MAEKEAFYNNWKSGSVPNTSTMSGKTPDPYANFSGTQGVQANASPTALLIYEMPLSERKELAVLLKKAGYKVPTSGKYSDSLLTSYLDADQKRLLQSQNLGREFTVREYLLQETPEDSAGATGKPSIREDIQIWNPTKITREVQDLSVKLLGREATAEEIDYIGKKLTKAQEKQATRTQYVTKDGKVTARVTGGLDEEQFLIDIFQKDKKFASEIAAAKKKKETTEASAAELTRQDFLQTAIANGITLNQDQIASFEERLKAGEKVDAIKNTIRETAVLGLPDQVKKLASSGVDLATIYSPYKSILASTLEVNPNSITLDDPTLRMAIGPDKEMSLFEYKKALRKDPRWQYTENARETVSSGLTQVLRDFGFMG